MTGEDEPVERAPGAAGGAPEDALLDARAGHRAADRAGAGDADSGEFAEDGGSGWDDPDDQGDLDVIDDPRGPVPADADPLLDLIRERDEYREALIRMQADFENYKKRMIKQQTDHLERAAGALVEKLLPVLDTADLALAHGGGEDVKQLSGTLANILEREGLERIDPLGVPFDPTLHDAVAHEPGEGGQEVVEVLRAGYRWKGRVLRPAMVKVRG
jgi:molecular chaperone GrpE